ncbi:MAG TPA: hypothetical protein VG839_09410, partial [Asticcacaulis sp.]|nr:hypothetical protein [Asticcacaulis sp.]
KALQGKDFKRPSLTDEAIDLTSLMRDVETLGALGQIVFDAADFHARPRPHALRLLAAAAVSAGGGNRLPRHDRVGALYDRLAAGNPATLSGARVQQTDGRVVIGREAGDIGRHAEAAVPIASGQEAVWDGRFALTSSEPGVIRPAKGLRAGLPDADRLWLNGLPAAVRDSLPVFEDSRTMRRVPGIVPYRQDRPDCVAQAIVIPRFFAACGVFATERDLQEAYAGGQNGL